MATKKVILFVEGTDDTTNGDLRQGFSKLLEKELGRKLPKIRLGNGKSQAVKSFLKNKLPCDLKLLLVDLDNPETEIDKDLEEYNLLEERSCVFYMIQEMEGWFLSQPDVLDSFYGKDKQGKLVSDKMTKKKGADFSHPDEELQKYTKDSEKGKYHKVRHAVELLKLLNTSKLMEDFEDFKKLVEMLK